MYVLYCQKLINPRLLKFDLPNLSSDAYTNTVFCTMFASINMRLIYIKGHFNFCLKIINIYCEKQFSFTSSS